MAEAIKMAGYRLVSLSYNGKTPDKLGAATAGTLSIIYVEAAINRVASFRLTALSAATRSPDRIGAVSAATTAMIYVEAPVNRMATYRLVGLSATTRQPDKLAVATAGLVAFLIRPPFGSAQAGRFGFIIEQKEVGPPAYVKEAQLLVTAARQVPPVSQVISYESVRQTVMLTSMLYGAMPFPLSYTRAKQLHQLVLQAKPISTISYESVKQVRNLAATQFNYIIPGDVWSKSSAAQTVMLVCQSLTIPYTPTSGEYLRQNLMLVALQSAPMPIRISRVTVRQESVLVALKRPQERLPRSITRVPLVTTLASQRRIDPMPRSAEFVGAVLSQASVPTVMPEPHGPDHVAQLYSLALVPTVMPAVQGVQQVKQERVLVSQARPAPLPISREAVPQVTLLASQGTSYPAPGSMSSLQVKQERTLALVQSSYPPPTRISYTAVPQVAIAFMTHPPASYYPDPEVVYERSRYDFVSQFVELVTMGRPLALPLSYVPVPQLAMLTAQHADYLSPEEMARSGAFTWQVIENVATTADYPSADAPASRVIVPQLIEHVAVTADYPDAHLPVNYAIVTQVVEHTATVETYPDPGTLQSVQNVWQVSEQLAVETDYPDAGALHSPVIALQLVEQVTSSANYPDKDFPQSFVRLAQATQQVAFKAAYPNKDVPQSSARVNQVLQHVARRDLTMYQLPVPPRRHRVRVVCRFVY
ncbi:hypothetical protein [Cronobacter phage JC01]|uniref:Uncharacterized protein n=1 Tax=Cronobacter phage JC01 TaxID=2729575 RepID=A0A6M3YKE5_9CAUD|nr:hypothetical protein JT331_gp35 [Cronobacter phage JC01]QJI52253.1 hypothetical protein [Cronobacter phage JC01]